MPHTVILVISMTSHFMLGRARRFLTSISRMQTLEKSMFVMCWQPASYLQVQVAHTAGLQVISRTADWV